MTFHCVLMVLALCSALRDRPVAVLDTVEAGTASWDWAVTRIGVEHGGGEADPMSKPFVHSNIGVAAYEASELAFTTIMAHRTRHSRHAILRDTWWAWQVVPIGLHAWGASTWYGRPRNIVVSFPPKQPRPVPHIRFDLP